MTRKRNTRYFVKKNKENSDATRKPFKELNENNHIERVNTVVEKPPNTLNSSDCYYNTMSTKIIPPPGFGYFFDETFSFPDFEELKIAVMEDNNLRLFLVRILNERRSFKNQQYLKS
jgi:hypothetical protein